MKNFKKIILGIGTIATTITPIVTVISCGSEDAKQSTGTTEPPIGIGVNSVFLSVDTLIEALKNDDINGIRESIENINYEIVDGFLKTVTLEKSKVLLQLFLTKVANNDQIFVEIVSQENIDKIANIFDSFKKDFPEIESIDSQEFATALVDFLGNWTSVKEESINTLISFAKVLFPSSPELIDGIGDIIKAITTNTDGLANSLESIFDLIEKLFTTDGDANPLEFIEKILNSKVLTKLIVGETVDETDSNGNPVYEKDENGQDTTVVKQKQVKYDNFNDFVTDLKSLLPGGLLKLISGIFGNI